MVSVRHANPRAAVAMWFGVIGAPAAWTLQLVFAFAITEAACSVNGHRWGLPVDAWAIVAMAFAAAVSVGSLVSAFGLLQRTRGTEDDEAPPAGVAHFFAVVGVTITPLFLAAILMTGFGIVFLQNCHQA